MESVLTQLEIGFRRKLTWQCFLQKKATKTPSTAFPTGHIPSLSERLAPERVVMMLNRYLTTMVAIIKQYQGTIDEFIGDAMAGNGSHLTTPGCLNFRGRLVSFCTASRQRRITPEQLSDHCVRLS